VHIDIYMHECMIITSREVNMRWPAIGSS
jgi:hypothetical protein